MAQPWQKLTSMAEKAEVYSCVDLHFENRDENDNRLSIRLSMRRHIGMPPYWHATVCRSFAHVNLVIIFVFSIDLVLFDEF